MLRHQLTLYLMSFSAAIAGLLFGFDTGVISGAIIFINKQFHLTPFQTECVISAVLLGALIGAISSGRLTDIYGRKKSLCASAILFVAGTVFSFLAHSPLLLMFGRFLLGLAIGNSSFSTPLYLSEISQKDKRGFIVGLYQLAITLGILLSYMVNYYYAQEGLWRYMLGFGLIPSSLLLFTLYLLPESPRFLMSQGKNNEAKAVLASIREKDKVESELYTIELTIAEESKTKSPFSIKPFRQVLLIGMGLAALQQLTGINTIIYYAPTILQTAGFHTSQAFLSTLLIGVVNVLVSIISLPLIDSIGRRKLLLSGLIGMMVSLLLLGLSVKLQASHPHLKPVMAISMMLYITSFAYSLGPMTFVIISEIFPLVIRGQSMSLAISANWLSNLLVAITFLSLIKWLGLTDTFYFYAFMCLAAISFVYWFIPETKGVSLEQLENNLMSGMPIRELGIPCNDTTNSPGEQHAT